MKIIEISRSFSKKIQEAQFEPFEVFASYKAEVGETENLPEMSNKLFKMAVDDVGLALSDKYFEKWTNPQRASRQIKKGADYSSPDVTEIEEEAAFMKQTRRI